MNRTLLVHCAAFSSVVGACVATESNDPAPFPEARYAAMSEQSPFALATPVAPPTVPMANFAAGWKLTGLTKVPVSGVPTDRVTVVTAENKSFSLTGAEEKDGVSVSNVGWSSKVAGSTVTLKKGTEFATVEFSHEIPAAGARLAVPPLPNAGMAGRPPVNTSHVLVPRPNLPLPGPSGAPAPPINRHAQRFIEAPAAK